jgi:hypothetical protein
MESVVPDANKAKFIIYIKGLQSVKVLVIICPQGGKPPTGIPSIELCYREARRAFTPLSAHK